MKRTRSKLSLVKETVRTLEDSRLRAAAGGTFDHAIYTWIETTTMYEFQAKPKPDKR